MKIEIENIRKRVKEQINEMNENVDEIIYSISKKISENNLNDTIDSLNIYNKELGESSELSFIEVKNLSLFKLTGNNEKDNRIKVRAEYYATVKNIPLKVNAQATRLKQLQFLSLILSYSKFINDAKKNRKFLLIFFTNTIGFRAGILEIDGSLKELAELTIFEKSQNNETYPSIKFNASSVYNNSLILSEDKTSLSMVYPKSWTLWLVILYKLCIDYYCTIFSYR